MIDRFVGLDLVRVLMAFLIVSYHFLGSQLNFVNVSIPSAYTAVDVFFVLSGFIISYLFDNKLKNYTQVKSFIFRRVFRLYPLHFLFLLIYFVLELFKYFLYINYSILPNNSLPFEINNFQSFIAHLFLIQSWGFFGNVNSYNVPSWSVSAEMLCYLFFGFISILIKNQNLRKFSYLIFAGFGLFSLNQKSYFLPNELIRACEGFFIGAILNSYFLNKFNYKFKRYSISSIVILLYLGIGFVSILKFPDQVIYLTLLLSAPLVYFSFYINFFNINIRNIIFLIANRTYTIYMTHFFILWIFSRFVFLLKPFQTSLNLCIVEFLLFALYLISIFFVSNFIYLKFELPTKDFLNKKFLEK